MSAEPYDVDQLAALGAGPDRAAYPTHDAYLLGWYTWRALRRDGRLTDEERAIQWDETERVLRARLGG